MTNALISKYNRLVSALLQNVMSELQVGMNFTTTENHNPRAYEKHACM